MPEGPQCRKAASKLEMELGGKILRSVSILSGRYKNHSAFVGYHRLVDSCPVELRVVGCVGKLIVMCFEKDIYILCTLGLTGKFITHKGKHSGVLFEFVGKKVYFDDQIHYGTLKVSNFAGMLGKVSSLGPDVCVRDSVTKAYLVDRLRKYNTWEIAKLLMHQGTFSGIGNYLKAEILYHSGIAPHSLCGCLTDDKIDMLLQNINSIAIRHYEQILIGRRERLSIYGRKKDPHGNKIVKIKTTDRRTSHWVPDLQEVIVN